ncbi:hypothetical protein FOVG_19458 [Fusarium oxysporum f. sp. pisi HDV247]|uniref:Magnesium transport protein CorA n=1 Tax=Fusarium oxysporum f. sp. pisi HDV247 TaxID=1080344 RepID=W9N8M7_FUSOX|nr:hypothetical protein FOVG_19458 [Fusarium oxysporum f. sp. pisi HDV247]
MPKLWWSSYSRRSNGFFGSETFRDNKGNISALNTWSRFLVKVLSDYSHQWHKFNIVTRWVASSQQTFLLIFDTPKQLRLREKFPCPLLTDSHNDTLSDPFWFYLRLFEELSILQDTSVWTVRDRVRKIEKEDILRKPHPRHRYMHDTARHAIHVLETLEVAETTVASIIQHHNVFEEEASSNDKAAKAKYRHVGGRLQWYNHIIQSLRSRASSNKERLLNEIQLAFNAVSMAIGHATQSDSAAMKTVAFVTLTFMPATFISALFSMSFFKIDDNTGEWSVSQEIWLYWVIAVPVTLLTAGSWQRWQRQHRPTSTREAGEATKRLGFLLRLMKRGDEKNDDYDMA